jgi:hypothetical protein
MCDEAGLFASFSKAISPLCPAHSYDSPVYLLKIECSLLMGNPPPYRKLFKWLSEATADTRSGGDGIEAGPPTHVARANLRSNIRNRHVQGAVNRSKS